MTNSRLSYALLAPVAVVSLSGCGINSVPAAQETVKAKWADVQNQYQRRADLVPNLVAVVKGYARQEQDTLTQVTEARAKATSVQVSADDLQNPEKMAAFQARSEEQTSELQSLMRISYAVFCLKKKNINTQP